MLSGFLIRPGKVELREVKTPTPGRGELLIRVKAALTCGTDLKAYRRGHPVMPMPGPFGHEFSGVVARLGAGVKTFKEGDPVMAVHSAPCLKCRYCKKRLHNLCENIMRTKALGAFAEYILLPPHIVGQNVYHKPPGLSFEEAALLEPVSCVVHGIEPLGINKGDTPLVIGAGPIGLIHIMLLRASKAVVAVADVNAERLDHARKICGKGIEACRPGRVDGAIKKLTGGIGFDYVFECTGRPAVWEETVNYLRKGGTSVLFGGCPAGVRVAYDAHRLHYDEITLRGAFHFTPPDVKRAYGLLKSGRLPFSKLISGRYPLKDIEKAFLELSAGKGIKYAVIP